eukprot:10126611-Alexandrium_andersonii.AAC.1
MRGGRKRYSALDGRRSVHSPRRAIYTMRLRMRSVMVSRSCACVSAVMFSSMIVWISEICHW